MKFIGSLHMRKAAIFFLISFGFPLSGFSQFLKSENLIVQERWIDSVFNSLEPEAKLSQLLMLVPEAENQDLPQLIKKYNPGSLKIEVTTFPQAEWITQLQKGSRVPMLIASEFGPGNPSLSKIPFPGPLTLEAVRESELVVEMGKAIADYNRALGIHINFISLDKILAKTDHLRFDSTYNRLYEKRLKRAIAFLHTLQNRNSLPVLSNLPNRSFNGDENFSMGNPVNFNNATLEKYLLAYLLKRDIPAIEINPDKKNDRIKNLRGINSSKSPVINNGYRGLIFSNHFDSERKDNRSASKDYVASLGSGSDILILRPKDLPRAVKDIQRALRKGKIAQSDIDRKVKKVLEAKYWAGLHQGIYSSIFQNKLRIDDSKHALVKHRIYERSVTLLKDHNEILPIHILDTNTFASVSPSFSSVSVFRDYLSKYAPFSHYDQDTTKEENGLLEKLMRYNIVVATLPLNSISDKSTSFLSYIKMLKKLNENKVLILVAVGDPTGASYLSEFKTVICAYENVKVVQKKIPQILFGALSAQGRLPAEISSDLKVGVGMETVMLQRIGYDLSEAVGMDSRVLDKINHVAREAILEKSTPGCQILVARKGKVIFEQSYGYLTYDSLNPVTNKTVYDIASITKIAATLQALMFLDGNGVLNLEKKLSDYLPGLEKTNKENLVLKDILIHQAGLQPFIPFWEMTADKSGIDTIFYKMTPEKNYSLEVSPGLFALNSLSDSIWQWTVNSSLLKPGKNGMHEYNYSDLGFYFLQRISESLLNQPMETFLGQNFYDPLGLTSMNYLPLCKYPISRIAPTENDVYFRNTLICGMVHDPNAAMYGGIAGHAGVFSNANDLAVLMQMNLQDGFYGGLRYLPSGIVNKYSKEQKEDNRRGLGFDKPELSEPNGPTSEYASPETYGHTGFTGTAVWVDPEFDLIYVFLSNRTYPQADNTKLIENNIRTRIQDIVYESIWAYEKAHLY